MHIPIGALAFIALWAIVTAFAVRSYDRFGDIRHYRGREWRASVQEGADGTSPPSLTAQWRSLWTPLPPRKQFWREMEPFMATAALVAFGVVIGAAGTPVCRSTTDAVVFRLLAGAGAFGLCCLGDRVRSMHASHHQWKGNALEGRSLLWRATQLARMHPQSNNSNGASASDPVPAC